MTMTIMAAAAESKRLWESLTWSHLPKRFHPVPCAVPEVTQVLSFPSSFVAFTKGTKGHTEMDAVVIAAAMEKGVETAYKAVMKPKRRGPFLL